MNNEGEDRISGLPLGVLHHILSFLDLKPAIRTCILSSTWRYVWSSLPFLTFHTKHFLSRQLSNDKSCFIPTIDGFDDFVDNVLNLREKSCKIRKFHLYYPRTYYSNIEDRLYRWILTALQSSVEDLCLHISVSENFELPEFLFSCKSLKKFELQHRELEPIRKINLPNSMSLPGLSTLFLGAVQFEGDNVPNKIFDTCPLLESLTFCDCVFVQTRLQICSQKLKHLVILTSGLYEDDVVDINKCTIKICAPNLISLHCQDYMSKSYSIENCSSLVKADIDMEIQEYMGLKFSVGEVPRLDDEIGKVYAQRMMKILRAVRNVETLELSTWFIEVIAGAPALMDSTPIKFFNLKCLNLGSCLSRHCINAIMYLLKIAPVESLFLDIEIQYIIGRAEYPLLDEVNLDSAKLQGDWEASVSLQSMLYNLKLVKIQGVLGRLNELMFLKILLKNGIILEKVLVHTSTKLSKKSQVNFRKQLIALPRASSSVKIALL